MLSNVKPFTANEAQTDKEGYAVKYASGGKAALVTGTTDLAIGVIKNGAASGSLSDIALPGEVAPIKLSGTVTKGQRCQLAADATFIANAGSGARVLCALALESGVSGDLVDALIETVVPYAS
jgi:hypothetical protein